MQKHITLQIAISLSGFIWDAIMKGSLENVLPYEGSLAPYSLRTPALAHPPSNSRKKKVCQSKLRAKVKKLEKESLVEA